MALPSRPWYPRRRQSKNTPSTGVQIDGKPEQSAYHQSAAMIKLNTIRTRGTLFVPALLMIWLGAINRGTTWGSRQNVAQTPAAGSAPTFYRDVLPILVERCQICHRAEGIAPARFETYEQTRPYAAAISAATRDKSMPPWFADPHVGHFSNDSSLSPEQIASLTAW